MYEAEVISQPDNVVKVYRGLCSTTFKDRLSTHNAGFNHRKNSKSCELSKYIWELKDSNKTYSIRWKILKEVHGRLVGRNCKLCVTEKMFINEYQDRDRLLNINCVQKCRHESKYLLSRYAVGNNRKNDTMD